MERGGPLGECSQIMNCGEFEDFGVDQRKRHDYEMSVAPSELYLGGGLTGLHSRGSPSLQEIFQRPWQGTTTYKGKWARKLPGEREI